MQKTALFYRDYDRYSGGHQKVRDYFGHLQSHPGYAPILFLRTSELAAADRLWRGVSRQREGYRPSLADLNFLAGMDWQVYLRGSTGLRAPVINLVQHVRHGDPASDVYPFLAEKAIRICVSPEVENAIRATSCVNGPVFTIPNGIDLEILRGFESDTKSCQAYILGNKQPEMSAALAQQLRDADVSVTLHGVHTDHVEVLRAMATSEVSILLPHTSEGFYLPALEAMALSDMVVVPDCVGNRSFCKHGENCLLPALELGALEEAFVQARDLIASGESTTYQSRARATLEKHSLERERQAFYEILDNLDQIW